MHAIHGPDRVRRRCAIHALGLDHTRTQHACQFLICIWRRFGDELFVAQLTHYRRMSSHRNSPTPQSEGGVLLLLQTSPKLVLTYIDVALRHQNPVKTRYLHWHGAEEDQLCPRRSGRTARQLLRTRHTATPPARC